MLRRLLRHHRPNASYRIARQAHVCLTAFGRPYSQQSSGLSTGDEITGQVEAFSDLPKDFGLNQHLNIGSELKDSLRAVLWQFKAPIRFAFAYGSGVFPQKGYNAKAARPMVDFIFGVSYADHFHSVNLTHNFNHYSFLRRFGSSAISHVQRKYGASVYFNPYVEVNGMHIKYGVVAIEDLCEDLQHWQTLYLAGRMHKPVKILRDHPGVRLANQRNLYSALRTALLLLPETFNEHDLYTTIAKISYLGDPRMAFGENPKKVENIVRAQLPHFRRLYSPFVEILPNVTFTTAPGAEHASSAMLQQDLDPRRRGNMVRRLPSNFRSLLYHHYRRAHPNADESSSAEPENDSNTTGTAFDRVIAQDTDLPLHVASAIRATVAWPSTTQSIKGILTAGPLKSWSYATEKLKKARAGRTESTESKKIS